MCTLRPLIFGLLASLLLLGGVTSARAEETPPNIVLILADDKYESRDGDRHTDRESGTFSDTSR